jgi:hypothetical protein
MPDPQKAVQSDIVNPADLAPESDVVPESELEPEGPQKPPAMPESLWNRLKAAAYQASPLPLFEKKNLPTTMGAVAGAATGGAMAIPVAGATAMLTSAAEGGTPQENVTQGLLNAGGEATGPLLRGAQALAPRLMQSAVKPVGDAAFSVLRDVKAGRPVPQVVQTLLDNGISVSRTGLARLQSLLGSAESEVANAVAPLTGTIKKNTVAAYALPTAWQVRNDTTGKPLQEVAERLQEFFDHPAFQGDLTPQEAQAMKVGTYKGIDYTKQGNAYIETGKALAHGLKEEIEHMATAQGQGDVRAMNAKAGRLIEAADAVAQRVARQGNTDLGGISLLAHAKTAFLASLVERNPAVKSLIARGLWNVAGPMAGVTPSALRSIVLGVANTPDRSAAEP